MKKTIKLIGFTALVAVIVFSMIACGEEEENDITFTVKIVNCLNLKTDGTNSGFSSTITKVQVDNSGETYLSEDAAIAVGGEQSFSVTVPSNEESIIITADLSPQITFQKAPGSYDIYSYITYTLPANDITLYAVITTDSNGKNSVKFQTADPRGGSGTSPVAVSWSGLSANGTANTVTTTALTLTFDKNPAALAIGNITVTGATKGTLTGSGTTRTLGISGITAAQGGNVTVVLTNPAGYTITPSSKTVPINKADGSGGVAKTITVTGLDGKSGEAFISLVQQSGTVAYGTTTIANNTATISLKVYNPPLNPDVNWTGTGSYWLMFGIGNVQYAYTNGQTLQQLGVTSSSEAPSQKFPQYTIDSATSEITFSKFADLSVLP